MVSQPLQLAPPCVFRGPSLVPDNVVVKRLLEICARRMAELSSAASRFGFDARKYEELETAAILERAVGAQRLYLEVGGYGRSSYGCCVSVVPVCCWLYFGVAPDLWSHCACRHLFSDAHASRYKLTVPTGS